MRRLLPIAAICLLSAPLWAQTPPPEEPAARDADPLASLPEAEPVSFKVALEKAAVSLAEPFDVLIEVTHEPAEKYTLAPGLDLKAFHLRAHESATDDKLPRTTRVRLTLQAFDVGEQEIPPMRMLVDTPAGARRLDLPAQTITVSGVIDLSKGEPQMKEDERPLPMVHQPVWWPMIALAALLLGAGLAWFVHRRMSRPPLPPPPRPRDPPDVEALARLGALEAENLPASDRRQEFFFRLSEIVRDYLGRRYRFDALERTTDELLADLRKRSTPGLPYDDLATFLRESDLVKFARREPTDGECKASIDLARRFVESTRPPPPQPSQPNGRQA